MIISVNERWSFVEEELWIFRVENQVLK